MLQCRFSACIVLLACAAGSRAASPLEELGARFTESGHRKLKAAGTSVTQLKPEGHELARIFLQSLAKAPQTPDRAAADFLLGNRVKLLSYPSEDLGEPYDWLRSPKSDLQWPTHLSRHYYLLPLAQTYAATHEEKYADKLVVTLLNWVQTFPLGAPGLQWTWKTPAVGSSEPSGQGFMPKYSDGPWTSLSAEARTQSWLSLLPLVAASERMTNHNTAILLNALLGPHRRLMLDFPRASTANQFVALGAALMRLGSDLPDFTGAEECRRIGLERVTRFARANVYDDGSVAECSPNYGLSSVERVHNLAVESDRVHKALRYYAFTMDPLGRSPRIAKGGGQISPMLKNLNQKIQDPEVDWILSQGAGGVPPAHLNYGYDWAGHFVMRSGWKKEDAWLFFDAGPRGAGHHDRAQLGIQLVAEGTTILADPGYYTYSTSGEEGLMARYLNSTMAHNAAIVDGEGQISFPPGTGSHANAIAGSYSWTDEAGVASAEGSYQFGFGEGGKIPVIHKRRVSFQKATREFIIDDSFSGNGTHTYDVLWQIPPQAKVEIGNRRVTIRTAQATAVLDFKSEAEFRISSLTGSRDPLAGWYSEHYGQLEPATTIRVSMKGTARPLRTTIQVAK